MKATTKRVMKWTAKGIEIPIGTTLDLEFSEENPSRVWFNYNGHRLCTRLSIAYLTFTGPFKKPPGIRTLERYSFDGIAKSVTGKRCEPDGYGSDGSPSWLLVLGYI